MNRPGVLGLLVFSSIVIVFRSASSAQSLPPYSFTKIVDTNTPRPDGQGDFNLGLGSLSPPVIDGNWVAFINENSDGSKQIWSYNIASRQFTKLVDFSTPVPDSAGKGTFADFSLCGGVDYAIELHDGYVLFYGADSSAPICNFGPEGGIYAVPVAGGAVSRAVDYTITLPGSGGTFHGAASKTLSQGEVVFGATSSNGDEGIWAASVNGTGLERIADENTVYNCPAGSHGGCPNLYSTPIIQNGNVVFTGGGTFGEEGWNALFITSVNSPVLTPVLTSAAALPSDPGPDSPAIPDTLAVFELPAIDGSNIYFTASDPNFAGTCGGGTFTGVFETTLIGGAATKIADTCDTLSGFGALNGANSFESISAGGGTVAFQVENAADKTAIYASVAGVLGPVIAQGDALLGSTVYGVDSGIGNNAVSYGRVLFEASLVPNGQTVGIYLAGSTSPAIFNVLNGASFQPGIIPGSWATIQGGNLSAVTDTWDNFIVNGNLPTKVDGVGVSVGGQPAYVYYINPGQINFIVPDVEPGSQQVTVSNSLGTSAAVTVSVDSFGPAFFLWPSNQVVATRQNFSYAVQNGTFPGTTTVPAKPGDVIILWGTGFGPTTPAAPAGVETPSGTTYSTSTLPTVTIDNVSATVYSAALAPGFAGLYQVAIQVPTSLANGNWPVQATIGGVQSPSGVVLYVSQVDN